MMSTLIAGSHHAPASLAGYPSYLDLPQYSRSLYTDDKYGGYKSPGSNALDLQDED